MSFGGTRGLFVIPPEGMGILVTNISLGEKAFDR